MFKNAMWLEVFAAATLFLSLTGHVSAVPVSYDEAVDGPLVEHPDDVQASDFLTLGEGTNVWVGTLFDNRAATLTAVSDTAAFRLPASLQVNAIRFSAGNFQAAGGNWADYIVRLLGYTSQSNLMSRVELDEERFYQPDLDQTDRSVFATALPLGRGNYAFCFCGTGFNNVDWPASFDYRVEIDAIRVVSIADTLSLVFFGLMGIAVARRFDPHTTRA